MSLLRSMRLPRCHERLQSSVKEERRGVAAEEERSMKERPGRALRKQLEVVLPWPVFLSLLKQFCRF